MSGATEPEGGDPAAPAVAQAEPPVGLEVARVAAAVSAVKAPAKVKVKAAAAKPPTNATAPVAKAKADAGAAEEERRPFAVLSDLHHDGEHYAPDGHRKPALTRAQFDHLKASGTVEGEWD